MVGVILAIIAANLAGQGRFTGGEEISLPGRLRLIPIPTDAIFRPDRG